MNRTHYRQWIVASLSVALFILVGLSPIQAQDTPGPIILNLEGDLWAWGGADQPMIQLTSWGWNESPILSPDGTRVAYISTASIFVEWLETSSGSGGFTPPGNIWVLDLASRQTFRVADQPADAVWNGPTELGKYIIRTSPVWSPDGQQLAWGEFLSDLVPITNDDRMDTAQLVVYDLVSQTTRVFDTFPISNRLARAGLLSLNWGAAGIALSRLDQSGVISALETRLYDLSGDVISEIRIEGLFADQWIEYQGQEYLFNRRNSDQWLDWRTGEVEPMPGLPEMYSLSVSDGVSFYVSDEIWFLDFPGQTPIELGERVQPFGISRDGQSVIYRRSEINSATGSRVYSMVVQSQSQMIEIGQYDNVSPVWGPTGWRIRSSVSN